MDAKQREPIPHSPIAHLAITLRPCASWRESSFAMLSAYFDAAGHESDQRFLVVAGFVSSVDDWIAYDQAWKERLGRDEITCFHMTEYAQSYGEFKGWRDQEARRRSLLSDLMDIIKASAYRKFVCAIENPALPKHVSEDIRRAYHLKAYSLAGRTCAARLREWLQAEHWETPLELVFEDGDIGKGALRDSLVRDGFPEPLFRPKRDRVTKSGIMQPGLTPLQAADFLAYEYFLALNKLSETRWAFGEFAQMVGPAGIYEAHNLRELEANLKNLRDLSGR